MKIGLVGPSYQQESLPFNAQRTINLIPIVDEQGKEVSSLLGAPGLSSFATAGVGPMRGGFTSANGRAFFVSGADLYETTSAGVTTNRGTLTVTTGNVSFTENTTDLIVCDGTDLYQFIYSSNAFAKITDVDLPDVDTVTELDGFIIANKTATDQFFISDVDNATIWQAIKFSSADSSSDKLVRVFTALGQLWLIGERTTEIWSNTGASAFPFERISGGKFEHGTVAAHSVVEKDDSVFWIARDKGGSGRVYMTEGFTPIKISTEPIEKIIQAATDKANIRGFAYEKHGHVYYMITGGGLPTTLVYDVSTQLWHERAFLNDDGTFGQHLAADIIFAFDKHLVGDRRNGNIYTLDLEVFSDNGEDIVRDRIFTHISNEDQRLRYNRLDISMETGVGLQSGDTDPLISMRLSKNGARTWTNWFTRPIGAAGEFLTKVSFRRLSIAETMTFHIRITDQVKVSLIAGYLK